MIMLSISRRHFGYRTIGQHLCLSLCLLAFGYINDIQAGSGSNLTTGGEQVSQEQILLYIGTYTRGASEGIYLFSMDLTTGALSRLSTESGVENPSFLASHPSGKFLYSVSEVPSSGNRPGGAVCAFSIDSFSGRLTQLNCVSSGGAGPCHLTVDRSGRFVLVANYSGGSIAALPIRPDGRLEEATAFIQHEGSSINRRRQEGPHAHSVNLDAANRFALVADLGLDKILTYRFDSSAGTLTAAKPPWTAVAAGSGPRHFAFHPSGRFAYVIHELSSRVSLFSYDPEEGSLRELQSVSTLPPDFSGKNSTAEVQVSPSGRFLYGSNRGHDSIAVFSIDESSGRLTLIEHESTQGEIPRNFGIDPSGRFLIAANQNSDRLVVFRIHSKNGQLTPAGHSAEVPSPVCVRFLRTE